MTEGLLPSLNLFTLIAVLVVVAIGFAYFMRKRSNRHPMDTPRGHAIDEQHKQEVLHDRAELPTSDRP